MRTRPFLPASEQPRPFSEVLAERDASDPFKRARDLALDEIGRLERAAADNCDPAEAKRLQCEAEALRCALCEQPTRR